MRARYALTTVPVMDLGPVGLWTHHLDTQPWAEARGTLQEIEELGYSAVWLPEAVTRDAIVASTLALEASTRLVIATGIVPLYARDAMTANAAWRTLEEAFPGRFILGIGVSHKPAVEMMRKTTYAPPLATMRQYLDDMDTALYFGPQPSTPPRRVLAALGPKMLALSAERADGAHPYHATPEHTATARTIVGPDKILAVEQSVVLSTDAAQAREIARGALAVYLGLPNYVNNWLRLGFTEDDVADGGSDRLVDAVTVWGDEQAVKDRVQAHLDAGANHVCVQVLPVGSHPLDEWRRLAPVLL
jgi:probable F420-dependent oxidoreductase